MGNGRTEKKKKEKKNLLKGTKLNDAFSDGYNRNGLPKKNILKDNVLKLFF